MKTSPKNIITKHIINPFIFMEYITAVIIEDIYEEVETLRIILKEDFPKIQILGNAGSVAEGVELILRTRPTILFMDVKLGGDLESFDIIREIHKQGFTQFVPIFMTAYGSEEYATIAMDFAAAKYFKKPIDRNLIRESIEKAQLKLLSNTFNFDLSDTQLRQLMDHISKRKAPERIFIDALGGREQSIVMKEVVFLETEDGMTDFVLNDGRKITSTKGLKEYADTFEKDYNFFRIHDKTLLNVEYLENYINRTLTVKLKTGKILIASKRRGPGFKEYLRKLNPTKLSWKDRYF